MAQQISNPKEKLHYYRQAAEEAERSAYTATDPDIRKAYLAIARTWIYLAEQLKREIDAAGREGFDHLEESSFLPPRARDAAHRSQ